ncbi:MAG: hypothetical protein ACREAM_28550 [Blastocatellia bacterium]
MAPRLTKRNPISIICPLLRQAATFTITIIDALNVRFCVPFV